MPSKKWDLEHRDFHHSYQREYQKAYKQVPEQKLKAQYKKGNTICGKSNQQFSGIFFQTTPLKKNNFYVKTT